MKKQDDYFLLTFDLFLNQESFSKVAGAVAIIDSSQNLNQTMTMLDLPKFEKRSACVTTFAAACLLYEIGSSQKLQSVSRTY
jgi:hypothetical protein